MPDICQHYLGAEKRHCLSAHQVRLYLPGPRCPAHTPSAIQGKPEPDAHLRKESPMTWINQPMIAFDVETTGVDVETDRIVTASIVKLAGNAKAHRTQWLINPGVPIPDEAAAIHGITTAKAQTEGSEPAGVLAAVVTALSSALAAGHPVVTMNGSFDLTILDRECRRHDVQTLADQLEHVAPIIDVRVLDKHVDRYRKGGRKLVDLCATYDVRHDGAHDATEDALAAARILWRIAQRYPEIGQKTPAELHDAQITWHAEQLASFAAYRRKQGNPLDDENPAWPIRPLGVPA